MVMISLAHNCPFLSRCFPVASRLAFQWGAKFSQKSSTEQNNSSTLMSRSLRCWIEVLDLILFYLIGMGSAYPKLTLYKLFFCHDFLLCLCPCGLIRFYYEYLVEIVLALCRRKMMLALVVLVNVF